MQVDHTLQPFFDEKSRVLILGTMPSVKSRELGFYYAHPRNRFWTTLSRVFDDPAGETREERMDFLKRHHIALFDVLASCDIASSSDSSIKNPVPNDLSIILDAAPIRAIFTTGQKAHQLYQKHCLPQTGIQDIPLPSTSPANCPKGIEDLLLATYSQIRHIAEE